VDSSIRLAASRREYASALGQRQKRCWCALAEELAINSLLGQAELVDNLRRRQPALGSGDAKSVFLALRELRNSW
jgi:hypothetical protein